MSNLKTIFSQKMMESIIPMNNIFIQPKFTLNNPNDQYEKEADAVADKVLSMEIPSLQTKTNNNLFFRPAPLAITTIQRKCDHCEEEEKNLQRKEMNGKIQRQPAPPAEESDIDIRRNPPGEKHDIKDPSNLATFDLLDPLNSSICYKDLCLPSARSVMNGLKTLKGNTSVNPVNNLPLPGLTKEQMHEAACKSAPVLCQPSTGTQTGMPNLKLQPIELHMPKFQFFDHRIIDHFIFNKYEVPSRQKSLLNKTAAELTVNTDLVTNITGHTDVHGGDEYNQLLSENRAHAVEEYFLTANVPSAQIWSVNGVGKQQPRFNDDAVNTASASKNRRVELDIKKLIWNATFTAPFSSTLQLQRKCTHCEEEKNMQRKEVNSDEAPANNSLENYINNLSSGGQPLPNEVRNFYEPRFGYDFRNVKVHTDNVAAQSAQSINALAYTSGNNIVFNSGQYLPNTNNGKKLLGHELTHVVQQNNSTQAIQKKEDWNFTPDDYKKLKKGKKELKFGSDSSWVPKKLQDNILSTIDFALTSSDPVRTGGISVKDFYHGHLVIPKAGVDEDITTTTQEFSKKEEELTAKGLNGESYDDVTKKNIKNFSKAMAEIEKLATSVIEKVLLIKGAAVMYHTFEFSRPEGMKNNDPARHIKTDIGGAPAGYQLPDPKDGTSYSQDYFDIFQFSFLVDEKGVIHVTVGSTKQLSRVTGTPLK